MGSATRAACAVLVRPTKFTNNRYHHVISNVNGRRVLSSGKTSRGMVNANSANKVRNNGGITGRGGGGVCGGVEHTNGRR